MANVVSTRPQNLKKWLLWIEPRLRSLQVKSSYHEMTEHMLIRYTIDISHELRTPLTLILGPVRELSRKKLSTAVHNQLSIVERNADRLLRLVTTIMDFASAEAGRMTSTFRPTYLGQFTANLASAFQSGAQLAGLGYKVDTSPLPFGLVVWVDQDKYEKIVYNLLSNALKYTLAGFVSVSTYLDSESGRFVLEVRDTGVGIPSGELEHVFERFHRVASTQGRSIEGTGIGLTYVLELVKMHKGEITVDSEPTRGSIFRVLLPLGNDHLPSESLMEVTPNDGPATLAIDRSTLVSSFSLLFFDER
jgi:signal transduction histidine kinase